MLTIALFELRSRLKLISTWLYFAIFFALGIVLMLAATGAIKGAVVAFGGGKVLANSPYALHEVLSIIGFVGIIVTAAMMGRAVQQDFEYGVHPFFFTAPISKAQYLFGRFLGALAALLVVFTAIALGMFLATLLPMVESYRVGPNQLRAYVQPYLTSILPNVLFTGAMFFSMAALTRKMIGVYLTGVIFFVGYLIAGGLVSDLDYRTLVGMLDPFGTFASEEVTRYWTITEKNTRFVPLTGIFLWNRVLWTSLGLALLGWCYRRFSFTQGQTVSRTAKKKVKDPEAGAQELPAPIRPVVAAPVFTRFGNLGLLPRLAWLSFRETVKNVYFAAIALCAVLFVFANSAAIGKMFGTETYPVTYEVLEIAGGTFTLFVLILITVYSGELVWREREAKLHQIHDALPIPTWLTYLSKYLAMIGLLAVLQCVLLGCGILIQAFKGYFHFELGLYLQELFALRLVDYAILTALAFAVHAVVDNKYLGHLVMVVYYLANVFSGQLGVEHNLVKFGGGPTVTYSDMNGYGHFLAGAGWFNLYWGLAALVLAFLTHLLWVRGTDSGLRVRLKIARARLSRPVLAGMLLAALAFVGVGAFIFHNTNRLNRYLTSQQQEEQQADYERRYKSALESLPQPKVVSSVVAADLFPQERRVRLKGTLGLENKSGQPVPVVHVFVNDQAIVHALGPAVPTSTTTTDPQVGLHSFTLAQPLAAGAKLSLEYDLEYANPGFTNDRGDTDLVFNGSFFNSGRLPSIGYSPDAEMADENTRKEHQLPPRLRMPPLGDPQGKLRNYISHDGDWLTFEATVSTSEDQLAVAPGYLQREWVENGRRYFHYKMDAPILNFYAFLSARYAVKRDRWNEVAIEVFHHPAHTYNVDRMIDGTKAGLEYFTQAFGPYQHRQVRILEFPRYASFAQSFPNTIPFSESIGFIARVDPEDPEDVDYPYYVTAHEVAHQWWAHQVIGANMQGSTLMVETLAQYSALMVMKKKFGPPMMGRFLRYELDRYLMGRATERERELPLLRVENQGYIHYNKGSLVMYLLQDLVGEEVVNAALKKFLDKTRYQGPPYPSADQLVDELRAAVPPEYAYLIKDLFEEITLYENRAVKAVSTQRPDGKYQVTLTAFARKVRADAEGREEEIPMADFVEVGLVDADGKALLVERKQLGPGEQTFTLVADALPAKAGIDPLFKLIDRQPRDNLVRVETE